MRTGNRHRTFQPHEFGEHFRPPHHRNTPFQCGDDFRIVALYRRGGNDHSHARNVLCLLADHHRNAALAQAFHDIAFRNIRALHGIAHVVHDFRDTGHADPADANEMDCSDVGADTFHRALSRARASLVLATLAVPSRRITSISGAAPKLSTRSARSDTALGRPQFQAA